MAQPSTITALHPAGRGRIAVEVDGARWRVLPVEAVHRAGLAVGLQLDRPTLRTLRRELRRVEALGLALGALRYRDQSTTSLADRLERRGVVPAVRERALGTLSRAGLVDDERFARGRAVALAGRGAGDLLIASDLERQGISAELVEQALAELQPEAERASRILATRGASPKTWRFLAAKGFTPQTLEALAPDG